MNFIDVFLLGKQQIHSIMQDCNVIVKYMFRHIILSVNWNIMFFRGVIFTHLSKITSSCYSGLRQMINLEVIYNQAININKMYQYGLQNKGLLHSYKIVWGGDLFHSLSLLKKK